MNPIIYTDRPFESRNILLMAYKAVEDRLKKTSKWDDPYFCEWRFGPIEDIFWQQLRCYSKIGFYPQYPVGKYYIDFASLYLKIGIEIDGRDYHSSEKDKLRDNELQKLGWKIYHISGSNVYKETESIKVIEDFNYNYEYHK